MVKHNLSVGNPVYRCPKMINMLQELLARLEALGGCHEKIFALKADIVVTACGVEGA
jgi:hypothetical protein